MMNIWITIKSKFLRDKKKVEKRKSNVFSLTKNLKKHKFDFVKEA